jgi:transmembrane sensor
LLASAARARGPSFPALVAWAALAACGALAAFWWWPRPAVPVAKPAVQEYATTSGGYQRMTLPDGSIVELNASSEVRVKYSVSERRVQLLRGEANFIVEKNKARPFWVEAGKVSVRAVGTAFNVRLGQSEVEVLVTEGRVEVNHEPVAAPVPAFPVEPPVLVAGQRLVVPLDTQMTQIEVQALSPAMIRETLSWQGARLVFVETPLAEVVTQFNQRNQVQLVLGDAELASLPVGGSFKAENVEAFVRLLASDCDIVVERPSSDHIVLRKAAH